MIWLSLLYDDATEYGSTMVNAPEMHAGRIAFRNVTMDAKKGTIIGVVIRDGTWMSDVPVQHETFPRPGGMYTLTELTLDIEPNTIDHREFVNTEPKSSRLGHAKRMITG